MRRDRFVVVETVGFQIVPGGPRKRGRSRVGPGVEVGVHDRVFGYREVASFASENRVNGRSQARRKAAQLAARLNAGHRLEAVSSPDGTEN